MIDRNIPIYIHVYIHTLYKQTKISLNSKNHTPITVAQAFKIKLNLSPNGWSAADDQGEGRKEESGLQTRTSGSPWGVQTQGGDMAP